MPLSCFLSVIFLCYFPVVLSFILLPVPRMCKQNMLPFQELTHSSWIESHSPLSLFDSPPAVSWECRKRSSQTLKKFEWGWLVCIHESLFCLLPVLGSSLYSQIPCFSYVFSILPMAKSFSWERVSYHSFTPLFKFNSERYLSQDNYNYSSSLMINWKG